MKKALITGGAGGIGEALCRAFAEEGYFVAVHYRSKEEKAKKLAKEIGGKAFYADFTKEEDVLSLAREIGDVSLLINNAALSYTALLQDTPSPIWDDLFAVNVKAPYLLARELLPSMIRQKEGNIINISSMWGCCGASCEAAYSAAKGAVNAFTKALAKEVAPSGIRVNAIAPGVIDTDMIANLTEKDKKALVEETPLCRLGKPEDIASCALFLASDKASFITGQIISPNGGFLT